jgi:hypothetical protein
MAITEGWYDGDYLILFAERASALEGAYGIASALPGYRLVGLKGWDDFVVEDSAGGRFTVPTVPLQLDYLEPFDAPRDPSPLEPDPTVRGRIKWYTTPLAFGGDPESEANVSWIDLDEHVKLVVWWNAKYRSVPGSS